MASFWYIKLDSPILVHKHYNMTLTKILILCFLWVGFLQAQNDPALARSGEVPEEKIRVTPYELFTRTLLNHKGYDTLLIENLGAEDISWFSQHSYGWLHPEKTLGTLKAGESMKLPLEMRVDTLPIAIYSDTLRIKDSKSREELVYVPIEVMLEAKPEIHIPIKKFTATLMANGFKQINFSIENKGNTELDYSLYTDVSVPWMQAMMPTQGVLPPGESQMLSLIVSGEGIDNGSYQGNAWISSNDPKQSRSFIQVDLTVSTEKAALISDWDKAGLCREESFDIPFQFKGLILGKGNEVIAEISDEEGSFRKARRIGGIRSQDTSGIVRVNIPENLVESSNYKIRLRSTDPKMLSIDGGKFLSVGPDTELSFEKLDAVCDTENEFELTQASPAGGVYRGGGVSEGKFFARNVGAGTHKIDYIYTTDEGCKREIAQEIVVKESPKISHRSVDLICLGSPAVSIKGGKPLGGYYEGAGIQASGLLIPDELKAGNQSVRYIVEQSECRSEVEVPLRVAESPAKPELVQDGDKLIAKDYHEYVWFNDGQLIPNGNSNILIPKEYGEFTLIVKNEAGCSAVSDPIVFEAPDIASNIWSSLEISPNPAINHLYIEGKIEGSEHPAKINMKLSDEKGRSMIEATYGNIQGKFKRQVRWSGLKPGIYTLSLEWEGEAFEKQVVISENKES